MPAAVEPSVPANDACGKRMDAVKPLLGSVNVRKWAEVDVGGRRYWKIAPRENEYVLASVVNEHQPSVAAGQRLGDDTEWALPFAFVWPRWGGTKAWTYGSYEGRWPYRQLEQRTPLRILENGTTTQGKLLSYRIGPNEWIPAGDVRTAQAADPPPPLLREGERWIDIDLDTQTLVAYEGSYPVYATLVSTG